MKIGGASGERVAQPPYMLKCIYFHARVKVFLSISFLFFSFGKYHVVMKYLGTYIQLDMGSMSYYC